MPERWRQERSEGSVGKILSLEEALEKVQNTPHGTPGRGFCIITLTSLCILFIS